MEFNRRPGFAVLPLVIQQIREFEARYPGLDQMMIHWAKDMPREEFKDQLEWFAKDVMPAFKR
jgi:hypothetical protein